MSSHKASNRELISTLAPWRRRMRLQRIVRWSTWGLMGGLATAAVLLVIAHLVPWADAWLWAWVSVVVWTAVSAVYGATNAPSLAAVARRTDGLLALAERLGTAWELQERESSIARIQRADALAAVEDHAPYEAVSLWPGRTPFLTMLGAAALVIVFVLLSNPMDRVLQERQAFQQQLDQAREELEEARDELTRLASPESDQDLDSIGEALLEAEEALANAGNKQEALTALSQAEELLQQHGESEASQQAQALEDLVQSLSADNRLAGLASALRDSNTEEAAQAAEELARQLASMSEEERKALAQAFQEAANAAPESVLAERLRQVARSLASGESAGAEESLKELARQLSDLQGSVAVQDAIRQGQAGISLARATLTGLPVVQDAVQEQARSSEAQGDASGQDEGAGGGVAGASPGIKQGSPTDVPTAEGTTVVIPSQGPVVSRESGSVAGAQTPTGKLQPRQDVFAEFAREAREHIERSEIPLEYKDLVKRYFVELEQ